MPSLEFGYILCDTCSLMIDLCAVYARASVTDQDKFDRLRPDPLSLTPYHWHYGEEQIDSLKRYDTR